LSNTQRSTTTNISKMTSTKRPKRPDTSETENSGPSGNPPEASGNPPEALPVTAAGLEFDPAVAAEVDEHDRHVGFGQALREEKRTLLYSVIYSGNIIMEGYGMALMPMLFSNTPFLDKFGHHVPGKTKHEVCTLRMGD
jgi:SP family general alpha glucoside:H+ symporter-like MFS transporter